MIMVLIIPLAIIERSSREVLPRRRRAMNSFTVWVVVKIRVPFGVP